jgi:hypothetical protein
MEELHYGPFYPIISHWVNNPGFVVQVLSIFTGIVIMLILIGQTLFFSNHNIKKEKKSHNVLFIGLSIFTLFIYRSLSFYADIFDPDEAHILTPALNILSDGRLWVAADSTTLGPVNYLLVVFPVSILRFIGIDCDITFFLLRCILTLLIIGTFFILYKICIKNISLKLTRVVLLFYVFFFSFSYHFGIQAYNSEFPFCFFFSLCIYLLYKIKISANYVPVILAGFFCGILPYIKLQTLPMMFSYIIWVLYTILNVSKNTSDSHPFSLAIKKSIVFFAAIVLPTIAIVIYCSTYEQGLSNAYFYYIKNAIAHVNKSVFSLSFLYHTYLFTIQFLVFESWYGSLFVLILLSLFLTIVVRPRLTADWWFSGLIVLSALFAILRPYSIFSHYMIFMTLPSLVFLITTLHVVAYRDISPFNFFTKIAYSLKKENVLSVVLVISWLFLFGDFSHNVKSQTIPTNKRVLVGSDSNRSAISQKIMQQTDPDDYIVVWGWDARINIYTNRRSATAQSDIERLRKNGNYPHENITNYINDIKRNRPKLIVDVVAPVSLISPDSKYALEDHEEIWGAIKNDYELTEEYPVEGGSYKIYTLKELCIKNHFN